MTFLAYVPAAISSSSTEHCPRRAHWYSFNDEESEISGFRVAVGKQPNATDLLLFQEVGLVTNVTLPLTNISMLFDGDIVYMTVTRIKATF